MMVGRRFKRSADEDVPRCSKLVRMRFLGGSQRARDQGRGWAGSLWACAHWPIRPGPKAWPHGDGIAAWHGVGAYEWMVWGVGLGDDGFAVFGAW